MTRSKKSRCYTCLSLDRNLKPIKPEEKSLLGVLCPEMVFRKSNVQYLYLLCWECEYMIVKIKRFQARVSKAQARLKLTLQGVIVDGLSSIKITRIETIDVPPRLSQIIPTDQDQQMLEEILLPTITTLKVDPEIINADVEEEKHFSGDYDELIPPTKILQASSNESTDTASESEMNGDPLTILKEEEDAPTQVAAKHTIIAPNVKHRPKKAIINVLQQNLTLRGFREAVKVTSGVPNLATDETVPILIKTQASVPSLRKTKDGISIVVTDTDGISILENDKGSVTNLVKDRVAPTLLEEPVLKRLIVPINSIAPKVPPPRKPRADTDGISTVEIDKGSVTNLVKDRVAPNILKRKESVLKRLIVPTNSNPRVAPALLKREEPVLKRLFIVPMKSNQPKEPPPRKPRAGYDEAEVKCTKLNETELNIYRNKRRLMRGYKGHPYKCDRCIQKFWNKKFLDLHNMKHDKAYGPSMCEVCEQRFPNKTVRDDHCKQHFIVYDCPKCQYQDNELINVSNHIRRVHEVSVFDCTKCHAVFKTYREKRRHTLTAHTTRKNIPCEKCGKTFTSLPRLKIHVRTHQREKTDCPVCKKKIRKNYLEKHMKATHDNTGVDNAYCDDCGIVFKSKYTYERHLKTSLKHNKIEEIGIKCDHCNKYFQNKSCLTDHHEDVKGITYMCDICKKVYRNKLNLARHIRVKHEGKIYQLKSRICEYCGKSFKYKQGLTEHLNKHLGLRPYVCKDCGATFSYKGTLFTHRRLVHKVKRKYEMPTSSVTNE